MKKILCAVVLAGALMTSCGPKSPVTKGDTATLDTLSYAFGSDVANMMKFQARNIPIDFEAFTAGMNEAALGKCKTTNAEVIEILQDYFQHKRGERMREIMKQRKEQDSIRLAQGDSTKVEYPRHVRERGGAQPGIDRLWSQHRFLASRDGSPVADVLGREGLQRVDRG